MCCVAPFFFIPTAKSLKVYLDWCRMHDYVGMSPVLCVADNITALIRSSRAGGQIMWTQQAGVSGAPEENQPTSWSAHSTGAGFLFPQRGKGRDRETEADTDRQTDKDIRNWNNLAKKKELYTVVVFCLFRDLLLFLDELCSGFAHSLSALKETNVEWSKDGV